MSAKSCKIVQLETENVKRLKAVSITPSGHIVEITGKNGNGKSSVLDSIYFALGGKDVVQVMPIRKGEKQAISRITLDNGLLVTCKLTAQEDGTFGRTLTVESEEFGKVSSPQKILDGFYGALTFDPLEFSRKKSSEQFEALKPFVPNFDFDDEAKIRKTAFDSRTDVNRRLKEMKAQFVGINLPDDLPADPVDVAALSDEIQSINDANADIDRRSANRERVAHDIQRLNDGVEELRARLADIQRQIDEKSAEATALSEKLEKAEPLPEKRDTAALRDKIVHANTINQQIKRREERDTLEADIRAMEARAEQLTADIEASDKRKAEAIATAEMPVPGIGFGDGYLTLNDVPFDQASSAEQLRASVLMAMAANPRLRVLLVRDGSLLDPDSMQILADMAAEHDFQVWCETVASDRPGAIVIEDGMIKAATLEAAE